MLCAVTCLCVASPATTGSWSTPSGCTGDACTYRAEWSLDAASDVITFTVAAKQQQTRWTGIAFAPQKKMARLFEYLLFDLWKNVAEITT